MGGENTKKTRDMKPGELRSLLRRLGLHKPSDMVYRKMNAYIDSRLASGYGEESQKTGVLEFIFGLISQPGLAYATAFVLLLGFSWMYYINPVYPVLANVSGTVKVFRSASNLWELADAGHIRINKGDIVKTFGDGSADVLVKDCYHARIKPDSEIQLACAASRAFNDKTELALAKGRTLVNFNRSRKWGKSLTVSTEQAAATCIGTDFMVSLQPAGQTWVGVLDGIVKVSGVDKGRMAVDASAVLVQAGEKTVVSTGRAPAKPVRLAEYEMLEMQELYGIGTKPQVALLISNSGTRARELLALTPIFISADNKDMLPDEMRRIVSGFNAALKDGSKEKQARNIEELEEFVAKYPNPKYDAQFLLFIGSYYIHMGEYSKAIDSFNRVAGEYPGSSLASLALCAMGIVYEEKLLDIGSAIRAYKGVLSKYPASKDAQEAAAALKRLKSKVNKF